MTDPTTLPWAATWQRRCRAVREIRRDATGREIEPGGRCELVRGHDTSIDHAIERGFDTPRWTTAWSDSVRNVRGEIVHGGLECDENDRQLDVSNGALTEISAYLTNSGVRPRDPHGAWRLVDAVEELIARRSGQ